MSYLGIIKEVILICDDLPVNMVRASEFSMADSVIDIVLAEMIDCAEYLLKQDN